MGHGCSAICGWCGRCTVPSDQDGPIHTTTIHRETGRLWHMECSCGFIGVDRPTCSLAERDARYHDGCHGMA